MTKNEEFKKPLYIDFLGDRKKMDRFQVNTIKSFRKVKEDIKNLQAQLTDLDKRNESLLCQVVELKQKLKAKKR